MTHIAFVNMAAHGHIHPTLALVGELVRRDVRVSYAIPEGFQNIVSVAGAEPRTYASRFEIPKTFTFPPNPKDALSMPIKLLDEAAFVVEQLEDLYRDDRPDLVCYDFMAPAGRLFAQKLAIPAVRLHPSYAANETFSLAQRFMTIDPHDPKMGEFAALLTKVLQDNGLPPLSPREFMMSREGLNIVFMPRSFHYDGESFDSRFLFVGPCLREEHPEGRWRPKLPDRPTLLISLGTVFNNWPEFFKTCITAFGGDEWNVVMVIGSNVDPETLGPLPANFEVSAYVPQLDVLRKARAFITHGGMNSTMEALHLGVPFVVIPQMMEQTATALRVQKLNLGRYLPRPEVTAATLRHALADVLADETIRENMARMRDDVQGAGGARKAADGILSYLGTHELLSP